jgi:hypothetical protein
MPAYFLHGPKWGNATWGTSSGQILWSFALSSWGGYSFDAVISDPSYQQLVRDALAAWESVANIDFIEVIDSSAVELRFGWDYIDGPYQTVGEASWKSTSSDGVNFSIFSAEVRFDTTENWSVAKTDVNKTSFFAVAVHEIGHALGLGHVNDPKQMMYPQVTGQYALGEGDIAGVRQLYGAAQNAESYGTAGNDTFVATSGNDIFHGLAGRDQVVMNGARFEFTIDVQAASSFVAISGKGEDQFREIERLQFSDGILAFDNEGNAGQAYRLYQAAFDRPPDIVGLGYWIRELDADKGDLAWMANNFIISEEFKSAYGSPETVSDDAFLNMLYGNVLDRSPDAAGYAYWRGELGNGFSRERVLASFSESLENKANVIAAIEEGIWFV